MGLLKMVIKAIEKPAIDNYKGKVGEAKVNLKLNHSIYGRVGHKQINNLILIDDYGKSHQIDHVEIRQNGIFCIETKNYSGLIFGNENQDKWGQVLLNGKKFLFDNPLKQNKSHIYHIANVLGDKYKINSVVVMVKNNADKIDCPNVVNLNDLNTYLENYKDDTYYSAEEMDEIYNKLMRANNPIKNIEHIQNIRKTQVQLRNGICPRCGGKLVGRNGRYGKFFGCSNYPKCTFVLNKNHVLH